MRVRQSNPFNAKIGGRCFALAVLAALVVIAFAHPRSAFATATEPPAIRQQRITRPKPKSGKKTKVRRAPVLARFKHETHRAPKTKLNCSYCHIIPSRETPDGVAAATKSNIKGYPYHDSCLGCHRKTPPVFFSGAAPIVCTVCHTRSSPQLSARELGPFPKQSKEAIAIAFPGYFPHAQRDHKREECKTCHLKDERPSLAININNTETPFKPAEGTFKTSPSGHEACFKCHWEDKKPRKDECAGCHLLSEDVADTDRNLLSPIAREWFKTWPSEWPKRVLLKFNHDSKSHVADCITCHLNITEMNTLDIFKAEVPVEACVKCHLQPTTPASFSKEMYNEDDDILEGRNNDPASMEGKNTCTGCHTSTIGNMPPPCSHYKLFDDTYFVTEDYPKSAKQIAERCKK